MEKQLKDFTVFESYQNRQVILNYYNDEDYLWKRDGFHFNSIRLLNEQLLISKKDGNILTLSLKYYDTVASNSEFQNFYILRNGEERLEIYFP
ncbi:hypothetical protein V7152_03350 [Neobacillus drentensis]|uniref:hypothetical protein n=1 Tax=Neobacillus drentensis TaxID=220684 RepID=UPI0030004010